MNIGVSHFIPSSNRFETAFAHDVSIGYARPSLVSHNSIVRHHLDNSRTVWQRRQFRGHPRLKLPAVFHNRRTHGHAA